jgi:hypothetical protein
MDTKALRQLRCALVTLFLIGLGAAAAFAQRPDWVQGTSKKFPAGLYLVGVGSGKTRDAAENQARASIAKNFKVEINATTGVVSTETLKRKDETVTGESQEKTVSDVEVGVRKTMEGIEISEVYEDPSTGTIHALAVLKRSKAQAILEDEIQGLDTEIVSLGKESDAATDKIEKLRLMLRRKTLMVSRDELNADYRVVDPASQSVPAPFSLEKERSRIASFLKNQFLVGVTATGDESSRMVQPATKYLSAKGISTKKAPAGNSAGMDVLVEIETDLDPSAEPVDDWYYCRWKLDMTATDQKTGNALVTESKSGKAGQLSAKDARKKAVTEMTKAVSVAMEALWNALNGEEQQ